MRRDHVSKAAFAMPVSCPSYPAGPYRFVDREYLIITYTTDYDALERVVPEPLEIIAASVVKYEFIRTPHGTGFGAYTASAQVIPVRFRGEAGRYTHAMFLDAHPPIVGGRELGNVVHDYLALNKSPPR
jgi:acetoacetate decarboxylase